jgi:hypothetical protein
MKPRRLILIWKAKKNGALEGLEKSVDILYRSDEDPDPDPRNSEKSDLDPQPHQRKKSNPDSQHRDQQHLK